MSHKNEDNTINQSTETDLHTVVPYVADESEVLCDKMFTVSNVKQLGFLKTPKSAEKQVSKFSKLKKM